MTTTINGHTLSAAELVALDEVLRSLKDYGGDSYADIPNVSPRGDGRWVPLLEIFPRYEPGSYRGGSRSNARRQAVRRLSKLGVLWACEVAYYGDCVKAVPLECVRAEEEAAAKGLTK